MNVAIVGSSGYIAGFLLKRFQQEESIQKVLKIDQNENADAYLNLLEAEKFNYDQLNDIYLIVFLPQFLPLYQLLCILNILLL